MLTKEYSCVKIDQRKDGITFVIFNRPEKRNAMSPTFRLFGGSGPEGIFS
jgi:enoyl-CoA hydratase/carnithine racemase